MPEVQTKTTSTAVKSIPEEAVRNAVNEFFNRPRGELRIRQISSRTYRCNWYLDHAIVLSRFVQAEAVGDGVIITDRTILGMKSPSGYHA